MLPVVLYGQLAVRPEDFIQYLMTHSPWPWITAPRGTILVFNCVLPGMRAETFPEWTLAVLVSCNCEGRKLASGPQPVER